MVVNRKSLTFSNWILYRVGLSWIGEVGLIYRQKEEEDDEEEEVDEEKKKKKKMKKEEGGQIES